MWGNNDHASGANVHPAQIRALRAEAGLRRKYLAQSAFHTVMLFISLAFAATLSTELTFGLGNTPTASNRDLANDKYALVPESSR
jgi:hypothetical protein